MKAFRSPARRSFERLTKKLTVIGIIGNTQGRKQCNQAADKTKQEQSNPGSVVAAALRARIATVANELGGVYLAFGVEKALKIFIRRASLKAESEVVDESDGEGGVRVLGTSVVWPSSVPALGAAPIELYYHHSDSAREF
jgi:hypothetical protein